MFGILLVTLTCTFFNETKCIDHNSAKVSTSTVTFGSYDTEQKCKDAIKSIIKRYDQDKTVIYLVPQCVKVN